MIGTIFYNKDHKENGERRLRHIIAAYRFLGVDLVKSVGGEYIFSNEDIWILAPGASHCGRRTNIAHIDLTIPENYIKVIKTMGFDNNFTVVYYNPNNKGVKIIDI